jgi:signal peptidase II
LEKQLKKFIKEYWLLFTIAGVVIALDQISKTIVRTNIPYGSYWMPLDWLSPFLRFVYIDNTGAAFGLFKSGGMIFAILAVIITIFITVYYPQIPKAEKLTRIAMAMQMGGALGNLVDRIFFGTVTDFIAVYDFPVFNIADSNITVGVGLLILSLWINERRTKKDSDNLEGLDPGDTELHEENL